MFGFLLCLVGLLYFASYRQNIKEKGVLEPIVETLKYDQNKMREHKLLELYFKLDNLCENITNYNINVNNFDNKIIVDYNGHKSNITIEKYNTIMIVNNNHNRLIHSKQTSSDVIFVSTILGYNYHVTVENNDIYIRTNPYKKVSLKCTRVLTNTWKLDDGYGTYLDKCYSNEDVIYIVNQCYSKYYRN